MYEDFLDYVFSQTLTTETSHYAQHLVNLKLKRRKSMRTGIQHYHVASKKAKSRN